MHFGFFLHSVYFEPFFSLNDIDVNVTSFADWNECTYIKKLKKVYVGMMQSKPVYN